MKLIPKVPEKIFYKSDKTGSLYPRDEYAAIEESKVWADERSGTVRTYKPLPKEEYPFTEVNPGEEYNREVIVKLNLAINLFRTAEEYENPDSFIIKDNCGIKVDGGSRFFGDLPYDERDYRFFKATSNWFVGPVKVYMKENGLTSVSDIPMDTMSFRELIIITEFSNCISFAVASKTVYPEMLKTGESAWDVITRLELVQNNDTGEIEEFVKSVLDKFPDKIKEYKAGKTGLLSMFIGETMKAGKAKKLNPKLVSEVVSKLLNL